MVVQYVYIYIAFGILKEPYLALVKVYLVQNQYNNSGY